MSSRINSTGPSATSETDHAQGRCSPSDFFGPMFHSQSDSDCHIVRPAALTQHHTDTFGASHQPSDLTGRQSTLPIPLPAPGGRRVCTLPLAPGGRRVCMLPLAPAPGHGAALSPAATASQDSGKLTLPQDFQPSKRTADPHTTTLEHASAAAAAVPPPAKRVRTDSLDDDRSAPTTASTANCGRPATLHSDGYALAREHATLALSLQRVCRTKQIAISEEIQDAMRTGPHGGGGDASGETFVQYMHRTREAFEQTFVGDIMEQTAMDEPLRTKLARASDPFITTLIRSVKRTTTGKHSFDNSVIDQFISSWPLTPNQCTEMRSYMLSLRDTWNQSYRDEAIQASLAELRVKIDILLRALENARQAPGPARKR